MANTYTQLYFHIVFAVKGRKNLISKTWKTELYKYISGIISNKNQKLLIINYINNQEKHHHKKTFQEEYIDFLKAYEIDFNTKYIFTDE